MLSGRLEIENASYNTRNLLDRYIDIDINCKIAICITVGKQNGLGGKVGAYTCFLPAPESVLAYLGHGF